MQRGHKPRARGPTPRGVNSRKWGWKDAVRGDVWEVAVDVGWEGRNLEVA